MRPESFYKLKTPPAIEPITLQEAKDQAKIDTADDDLLIEGLITAARQICEKHTGRCLIEQSWLLYLDQWPTCAGLDNDWWDGVREGALLSSQKDFLDIEKRDVLSVTSIKTYDDSDAAIVYSASNYFLHPAGNRIQLRNNAVAPTSTRAAAGIEIEFKAGYGADDSDVPRAIRLGILELVAYLYEHRGDDIIQYALSGNYSPTAIPAGVIGLWQPYEVIRL